MFCWIKNNEDEAFHLLSYMQFEVYVGNILLMKVSVIVWEANHDCLFHIFCRFFPMFLICLKEYKLMLKQSV